jgi:hypothetical protein
MRNGGLVIRIRLRGRRGDGIMGKPVFLLDVVGRTSGQSRPVMLMLVRRGDDLVVTGSNGGNPEADAYPDFATYQELTDRRLPVAVLERRAV